MSERSGVSEKDGDSTIIEHGGNREGLDGFRGQGSKAHHVQTLTLLRQDAETPALVTLTTGAEPP